MIQQTNAASTREKRLLFVILTLACLLRILLVAHVAPHPDRYIQADAIDYDAIAHNIINSRGYSQSPEVPFTPDNERTPIYPLTIAASYRLFGDNPSIVLWLQVMIGTLNVFVVYILGKWICGPRCGLIAAGFLALSPISIAYTGQLWSDTLFALMLSIAFLLFARFLDDPRWQWALIAGAAFGLATLTHPRSLYLAWLMAILFALIQIRKAVPAWRIIVSALTFLVTFYAVLTPWIMRNQLVFGVPNLSSSGGLNLLKYNAALTEASLTGEEQWAVIGRYYKEIYSQYPPEMNEAEFAGVASRTAWLKIARHPLAYTRVQTIGMIKTLLPGTFSMANLLTGEQTSLNMSHIYALGIAQPLSWGNAFLQSFLEFPPPLLVLIFLEFIYLAVAYLLSAIALFRRRSSPWTWVLASMLLYLAAVAGPAGAPRFRVAMMPFLSLLAAMGPKPVCSSWRHKMRLP